jgi:hypothetical protein
LFCPVSVFHNREMPQASRSAPAQDGFQRFTMDLPLEDHSRFKSLCALKQTTMRAEVQAIVAQAVASGALPSEALYVPLEGQLRAKLEEHCRSRQMSLAEVAREALKSTLEEARRRAKRAKRADRARRLSSGGTAVGVNGSRVNEGDGNEKLLPKTVGSSVSSKPYLEYHAASRSGSVAEPNGRPGF